MTISESKQRDVGKKRARIGPDAMDYLNVSPGDIIKIIGKRTTCAIVWPADEDEKYPDTIRIDGQTRKNLGVSLNDEMFIISRANGIKLVNIQNSVKVSNTTQLGFICEYCLSMFKTSKALRLEHMSLHKGPVKCPTCQVNRS